MRSAEQRGRWVYGHSTKLGSAPGNYEYNGLRAKTALNLNLGPAGAFLAPRHAAVFKFRCYCYCYYSGPGSRSRGLSLSRKAKSSAQGNGQEWGGVQYFALHPHVACGTPPHPTQRHTHTHTPGPFFQIFLYLGFCESFFYSFSFPRPHLLVLTSSREEARPVPVWCPSVCKPLAPRSAVRGPRRCHSHSGAGMIMINIYAAAPRRQELSNNTQHAAVSSLQIGLCKYFSFLRSLFPLCGCRWPLV